MLENTAEFHGFRAAFCTFEAAYAVQVVRRLFRFDAIFTQLMTTLTVRAFFGIESQKERRDAIEQREYCAQRT